MGTEAKEAAHAGDDLQAIGIILSGEQYAIRTSQVREVLAAPRLTRVPKAPAFVRGVVNLRGNILPVLDLQRLLGVPSGSDATYPWVVVLEFDGELLGIGAERTSKLLRISAATIAPPPPMLAGISGDKLEGVAQMGGGFLIFLNLGKVLETDSLERTGEDGL